MLKVLTAIFLGLVISSQVLAEGFILDSLPEAQKLAEKTKQPVLVIFGADYCVYCEKLKKDILLGNVPESKPYIICYIDIEKEKELKKNYGVSTIPDSRVIVKNAQRSKKVGYLNKPYREWLKTAE